MGGVFFSVIKQQNRHSDEKEINELSVFSASSQTVSSEGNHLMWYLLLIRTWSNSILSIMFFFLLRIGGQYYTFFSPTVNCIGSTHCMASASYSANTSGNKRAIPLVFKHSSQLSNRSWT